ncbi:hypothetical protein F3Y22_tig00110187pilonHSYRG00528 [Hibiscus syriacus]|uniref:RNase H type-1 domain-containing protein n=1 Tax=Hibiscus syriacus TaxID=106335 RepID=A0A6A3BGS0_HIBSY|nr:hypothetical protein F3Y22_tig00110187pilonHSYRG00528 [Hibiscus syriacus]
MAKLKEAAGLNVVFYSETNWRTRSIDSSPSEFSAANTASTVKGIYKKISSNPKPLIDNAELLIDFVSNKMNKSWMGLEKAPEGSFKNKLHGLGLRLLARVKPSEILLKSITKDVTNVQITYPTRDCLMGDPSVADRCGSQGNRVINRVQWIPPPEGFFKLNVDGAVTDDRMKGGIGGIIKDSRGSTLASFSEAVGKGPPTAAEMLAIIKEFGGCPNQLCLLLNGILEFIRDKDVMIRHIPRGANWEADKLAKEGIG